MAGKTLERMQRIRDTANYSKNHHAIAKVKDTFLLLGGNKYDEDFYHLIELLKEYKHPVDLNAVASIQNEKTLLHLLNAKYLDAAWNVSPKQMKKLRHAYYEFAIHNNFDLNLLIADPHNVFKKRLEVERETKYSKRAKSTQKINKQIIDELQNAKIEPTVSAEKLPDYLNNLQELIKNKQENLDASKLKRIRYNLSKIYRDHHIPQNLSVMDNLIREKENQESNYTIYSESFIRVKNVLLAAKNNPIRTSLRSRLGRLDSNKMDQDVFNIVNHLANLGLHYELMGLINIFMRESSKIKEDANVAKAHREVLQSLLEKLYAIFNALSVRDDISENDLKTLKKLIHAFAEKNNFDKKLFNLRKLYQQHLDDEAVAQKLKDNAQRKYAYIDNLTNEITQKKLSDRTKKKWLNRITIAVTTIVALGEGLVAAVFFGWLLIPSILIIGTAGFAVSYFLFKEDCYTTLKEYFVKGIFKDQYGQDISFFKKCAITGTIIFTTAGAAIYSIFAFSSTFVAMTGLLGAASIVFPPAAFALAALVAGTLVVSFSLLFYRIMADFIKNNRIMELGNYLKNTFIKVWEKPEKWNEMSTGQKASHYAQVAAGVIFRGAMGALTLGMCTILTVASIGLAYNQAVAFMKQMPFFTAKAIEYVSKIGVYALATPINSFFYSSGVVKAMGKVQEGIVSLANKILHPIDAYESLKTSAHAFKTNKLRSTNTVIAAAEGAFLGACVVGNALGNAGAPARDVTSVRDVQTVTGLSEAATKKSIAFSYFTGSSSVNGNPTLDAISNPDVAKPEMQNFASKQQTKAVKKQEVPLLGVDKDSKLSESVRKGLSFFNELRKNANDDYLVANKGKEEINPSADLEEERSYRDILSL